MLEAAQAAAEHAGGRTLNIAIASILQESNTFSPVMTRYEDFSPVFGRKAFVRHEGKLTEMG